MDSYRFNAKEIVKVIMIILKFKSLIITLLCVVLFITPALGQVRIKIVDQNNSPLPNAVIEFAVSQPTTPHSEASRIYVMDQVNKAFVPYVLVVPVNSLVSFPNSDDIRHHVYSFSPAKTFELKL